MPLADFRPRALRVPATDVDAPALAGRSAATSTSVPCSAATGRNRPVDGAAGGHGRGGHVTTWSTSTAARATRSSRQVDRYQAPHPDRVVVFAGLDYEAWAHGSRVRRAGGASDCATRSARGARGLKVWKHLGLGARDPTGASCRSTTPASTRCGRPPRELGLPVVIHVADPMRVLRAARCRQRALGGAARPPGLAFLAAGDGTRRRRLPGLRRDAGAPSTGCCRRHPSMTFVGAHVGCAVGGPGLRGRHARAAPNFHVDIAARIGGARPAALHGAALLPALAGPHPVRHGQRRRRRRRCRIYYRFLETFDDSFDYAPSRCRPRDAGSISRPGPARLRCCGLSTPTTRDASWAWTATARTGRSGRVSHHVLDEIDSQPDCWRARSGQARAEARALPAPGERVAVIGCGTSWFMAMCYAALREAQGEGWTDAFSATGPAPGPRLRPGRRHHADRAPPPRSSTRSPSIRGRVPTVAITGDPATAIADAADAVVALEFADERSVVQTRFATTVLALLRASLGDDLGPVVGDAERRSNGPSRRLVAATQVSFLGDGWTVGLAHEAALKMREAAQAWTEAYSGRGVSPRPRERRRARPAHLDARRRACRARAGRRRHRRHVRPPRRPRPHGRAHRGPADRRGAWPSSAASIRISPATSPGRSSWRRGVILDGHPQCGAGRDVPGGRAASGRQPPRARRSTSGPAARASTSHACCTARVAT